MTNAAEHADKRFFFSIILLIVLHLLIVLPLAGVLNVWADEASTLYTTQFGLSHAWQNALADEKQAPLYFWFLSLWRTINGSIFFARLFSIICSCLAIKFFGDLAKRFLDEKAAMAATAFFALHPYLIWASLEIRVYSAVILLSIGLLILFDTFFLKTQISDVDGEENLQSNKFDYRSCLFGLLAVVALYTNYYLGFLLVGCFAALVLLRKWREAVNYLLQMLFAGIAFAPLVWSVKSQFARNVVGFQSTPSIVEDLQILWNFLLTFLLPTEIYPSEQATIFSIVRVWLVRLIILAVIFLLIKNRRSINRQTIVFGTIVSVITAFLFAAYFIIGGDYVGVRHAAVMFAPFVLFVALVFREIFPAKRIEPKKSPKFLLLPIILTLIIAIFFVYGIYALYPNLAKRGDWARVAAFIKENEQPDQPIIIFTTFDALALPYYYDGANRILPDEKFFDFDLEAAPGSADSWKNQTEFIISEIPPNATQIWLVTNEKCAVKDACAPLENYVRTNYTVVKERQFYRENVRLLRKN